MINHSKNSIKLLKNPSLRLPIKFVMGHLYLNSNQVSRIKQILNSRDANGESIISDFEQKFAALIGQGYGISFAAGRMAFYSLLKALNIGVGDEIILLGFTCSVMLNAVLRTGATPVFSDIDKETFGSDADDIEKKITPRTKIIVAQHSFGISCKIKEISELARRYGIFMVEDCAIAFDSSREGIKVGNWGDAAIFSTGHNKPLNTLIGGLLYTKNKTLYERIKKFSSTLSHLDKNHQYRLYKQFLIERKYYNASMDYVSQIFMRNIKSIARKLSSRNDSVFLEQDYDRPLFSNFSYPYPAKIPAFLAQLGLFELERWDREKLHRKSLLNAYLDIVKKTSFGKYLPEAYNDSNSEIVPLRFVFTYHESERLIKRMSGFIETDQIWFRSPIICSPGGPESLGYKFGSCPISEKTGQEIVNWPCVTPENLDSRILEFFKKVITD